MTLDPLASLLSLLPCYRQVLSSHIFSLLRPNLEIEELHVAVRGVEL